MFTKQNLIKATFGIKKKANNLLLIWIRINN